jgi:hypothetical protein
VPLVEVAKATELFAQRLTMPAAKASLTRRPVRERIRILVAPKRGVIMAVQLSGARFQVSGSVMTPTWSYSDTEARR